MNRYLTAAVASIGLAVAVPGSATTLFDNPFDLVNASCAFTTECGFGEQLAAQKFTLTAPTKLTSASFTAYDDRADPLGVNWWVYAVSTKGLPGALLASGTVTTITSRDQVGTDGDFLVIKESFALPLVSLASGSYYFGFQAITDSFSVYLASASQYTGAAESYNNGSTWRKNYQGFKGVAISLSDSAVVPEPATWMLLIGGFGLIGFALRRRRTAQAI